MRQACLGLALLSLSACASFDGAQEPVLTADSIAQSVVKNYDVTAALEKYHKAPLLEQKGYRNRALSLWLMAIDARYDTFRRDLSRSRKGSNVTLDTLTLGLTSIGSFAGDAAEELAAAATGVGGAKATLDRELYFERTLPVLVAQMDAERLKLRGRIIEGMGREVANYSLEEGFADLWRYQSAGSLDRAIAAAAKDAANSVEQADFDYSLAVDLCLPDATLVEARREIGRKLLAGLGPNDPIDARAEARKRLLLAAQASGKGTFALATTTQEEELQKTAALAHLRSLCTSDGLTGFTNTVFPATP